MSAARLVAAWVILTASLSTATFAADYPAPRQGDFIVHDFKFHTGEVMHELRLHYATIGGSTGTPVLLLHGTGGSGANFLTKAFADEMFGPGQPLDAGKYFIILPDAIGAGHSTRPSEGLRTKFPTYNYDDMVQAQYRLITEGLGLRHLRLVMGNSMGGMQTWMWGERYPGFMDALVPMAAQPTAMASRNWILRRMMLELIRNDPQYDNGNYTKQPPSLRLASVFFGLATSGGSLAYQKLAPSNALADKLVDERLAAPSAADANDFIYQWRSSADYDAAPGLERIEAALLAINSADDERNPPESGIMERELKRVKNGKLYLIPPSDETRGHGTTGMARFYAEQLRAFLAATPSRGM